MLVKDLIAQFNIVARTEYNQKFKEFDPKFKDILFEYQSGPVASVEFPFAQFLTNMQEFRGSRSHQMFPDGHKFTVVNKEWDMAVDIKIRDLKRAAGAGGINGLDLYRQRIAEMPKQAKDHPIELAFDMLEVGDASTYGTCFDSQNFFDTTHDYAAIAGSQSNMMSGAGVTAANIHSDLLAVRTLFESFYFTVGAKRRKLNSNIGKMLVIAPVQLAGVLYDLMTKERLATGESNTLRGTFDYTTQHFTDANDWYAILTDDPIFRPFLYQVEEYPQLDMPTPQDESARERKIYTYGANGSYNVAYGAWWKAVMVYNS